MRLEAGLASLAAFSAAAFGQGFTGKFGTKTTIVLERRLPAAVKLAGDSFSVKSAAERPTDPCQKLAADNLKSTVETALVRYNPALQLNPEKPDTLISVRVLDCNADARTEYTTTIAGKNKGQ